MRVPRSSLMALAALMTGTLASAGALGAETAALDLPPAESPASTPATPPPTTEPAATSLPDYKPEPPAPEPAAPVAAAPVAPVDPLGAAVFARLGETAPLLLRLTGKERDAIRASTKRGAYKPLWIVDGAWTEPAKAVAARLAAAAEDGLDARAYPVPTLAEKPDEKAVADADLRLSAAVILYARDARGGRVNLPRSRV